MADSAESSADPQITFKVKSSGDKLHTLTMSESATVADLKAKLAGSEFENIPPERQRLIYSGRVLKNEELLKTYKIKNGNTIHLVKSAASNPTPSTASTSTPASSQVPTNMASGTAHDPLANLTSARYAGMANLPSADLFGPDGGMGQMNDDHLANLMSNPQVAAQMNELMNNDQFLNMIIEQTPLLRNNPGAREMVRSPLFRQMMTNPEAIRNAARLQRMMRDNTGGAFPMPGVTNTTPGANNGSAANNDNTANNTPGASLADQLNMLGMGGMGASPFGALINPFGMGAFGQPAATGNAGAQAANSTNPNTDATTGAGQPEAGNAQGTQANPFASLFGNLGGIPSAGGNPFGVSPMSPEAIQRFAQMMASGAPPAAPDNRPPEERYAEQLRQLNDMGFYDFDRNIEALRRSGGSVQGAIEHLLSS